MWCPFYKIKNKTLGSLTPIWLEVYNLESIDVHSIYNIAYEKFWAIVRVRFYHRIFSDILPITVLGEYTPWCISFPLTK